VRREECDTFGALLKARGYVSKPFLAEVQDEALYQRILKDFKSTHPGHCDRLTYIYNAQKRFYEMMEAWKTGDIATLGRIFREDGIGLRDEYAISGPELESMCDIVRTVPGVCGERMLGGGDKGASGAIIMADAEVSSTVY
jgi:galactokinase